MKLGNEVGEGATRQVDVFMVGFEASVEIDRPLARNIVRYFDIANLAMLEILSDDVIRINVPTSR